MATSQIFPSLGKIYFEGTLKMSTLLIICCINDTLLVMEALVGYHNDKQ